MFGLNVLNPMNLSAKLQYPPQFVLFVRLIKFIPKRKYASVVFALDQIVAELFI